jgi:uncharacterized protein YyaL (SSP411 family)
MWLNLVFNDVFDKKGPYLENKVHLATAMAFLEKCYSQTGKKGISKGYFFFSGWKEAYPEVTGYCIPTLFECADRMQDKKYKQIALQMADWLVSVQLENGAFPASDLKTPIVFDTAQVLRGLCFAYSKTKSNKYFDSAVKAADWLVSVQQNDGSWSQFEFRNNAHAFHSQVAWALLECYKLTKNKSYLSAAKNNLTWVLSKQLANGWVEQCEFYFNPPLHTIAYAVEGILMSGLILKNKKYLDSARRTADVLLKLQNKDGSLYGSYDKNWNPTSKSSCLTGDAQIAVIWFELYRLTKKEKYLQAAKKSAAYLKTTQIFDENADVFGGIKGSHPVYGKYEPFRVLSWATKFFIDALLMVEKNK